MSISTLAGALQLLGIIILFCVASVAYGWLGFFLMFGIALYLIGQELPPRDPRP